MKTIERNINGVIVNQRGRDNYFLLSDILAVVTKCNEVINFHLRNTKNLNLQNAFLSIYAKS